MTDLLGILFQANLAAAAAIGAVLMLRRPVRAVIGAEIAYDLWLAVPLAAAASVIPARSLVLPAALVGKANEADLFQRVDRVIHSPIALQVWLAGALLAALALAVGQLRFLARERRGQAGPAVVGVIIPRFVVPADYERRFSEDERRLIRAHERTHIDRGDAQANAVIAPVQVLFWFNPMIHLLARFAREDQELACDAAVLQRLPRSRRPYAEALLKTQLGGGLLPLGCHWPAPGRHPLEVRIGLLRQAAPRVRRRIAGQAAVIALAFAAGGAAWLAKPVRLIAAPAAHAPGKPDPTMLFLIYRHGGPGA